MKKTILLFLFSIVLNSLSFAQDEDIATMECLYKINFSKDTTKNNFTSDLMILRLKNNKSIFFSEASFHLDSLLSSDKKDQVQADMLVNGFKKYRKGPIHYSIIKDFETKKLHFVDNIGGDRFKYIEDLPKFNWVLTKETKQIKNYTCQKATSEFRGRTYEAWFTKEIPVSDGPWKFNGLPGLILEVYDSQKHYTFTFLGFRKTNATIKLLPHKYITTDRKKYQKAYKNFMKDPVAYITASSGIQITLNKSSSRKKKRKKISKYDMMERY